MAEFSDKRELDRQSKARTLRAVTDPKKLAALKLAGFDEMGRSTGWGKAMDWIDPFATVHIRNAVAKKNLAGSDGRRVFDETRDEFTAMNLGQHKFTADIFKTIFGGKGMGAMGGMGGMMGGAGSGAGAAGGGASAAGGAGGFLGNIFGGGGGQGANMMKTVGNVQQGMQMFQQAGEGIGGAVGGEDSNPGYEYGEGTIDANGFKTNTVNPVKGSSNGNLRQDYPPGTRINEEGILVDAQGNPVDYDMQSENGNAINKFNNIADGKEKDKAMWGDAIKSITDPNADLMGSAINMTTAGIDYYNEQNREVNNLRKINTMEAFNFL